MGLYYKGVEYEKTGEHRTPKRGEVFILEEALDLLYKNYDGSFGLEYDIVEKVEQVRYYLDSDLKICTTTDFSKHSYEKWEDANLLKTYLENQGGK